MTAVAALTTVPRHGIYLEFRRFVWTSFFHSSLPFWTDDFLTTSHKLMTRLTFGQSTTGGGCEHADFTVVPRNTCATCLPPLAPSKGPSGGWSQGELKTLQLLLWIIANENLRNPQKQARCRGTLHDDRKELATERKGSTYRVVQKNSCMFEFSRPLSAHRPRQPMHCPSALTDLCH